MNTLIIAVLSFVGFIVAYHTYGKWLARKIFGLDAQATVPSQELRDDVDYVPYEKRKLSLDITLPVLLARVRL